MKKVLAIALTLFALSSCTFGYQLVEPQRQQIGGLYSVQPQIQWSKFDAGWMEMWTVDGSSLEAVRFYKGLKEGDTLIRADDDKLPAFRSKMRANQVREFVVDTLAQSGGNKVKADRLRPMKFGGRKGFRFDLSFLTEDGLAMKGIVVGAVIDGKLQMIIYTGTQTHYFARYKKPVERLMASIRMS